MVNPHQNLISVVVPVFQEDEALPAFLAGVRQVLDQCAVSYEFVLVDDGSSDNSWPIISKEASASSSVRGFRLSRNFGKEAALCAGLERAKGMQSLLWTAMASTQRRFCPR
jgi:Glycosyltransferases involved in cell wall biogenesis